MNEIISDTYSLDADWHKYDRYGMEMERWMDEEVYNLRLRAACSSSSPYHWDC